ncbi:MAG: hypothetical protein ABW007_22100 [Chitinophagaceae bacterium]
MTNNKEKDIIKDIISTGSEISGGIGSAIIGGLLAGPAGWILGGASGPIVTKIFNSIGTEIKERFLSHREGVRIGAAYTFAIHKIRQNESNGQSLRDDDFFKDVKDNRPASEEVLEGIILSSQREFEELKIKFLGNLYANVCFNKEVSKEHANQLTKTANHLSFRQYCILQLMNEKYIEGQELKFKLRGLDKLEIREIDIIAEFRDLQQRGLIYIPATYDGGNNSDPIQLEKLSITKGGRFFCDMLSLEEIEKDTLDHLNSKTYIKA